MKVYVLFCLFLIGISGKSQVTQLIDSLSGEPVPYAHIIYFDEDRQVGGTYTNSQGMAIINMPEQVTSIVISAIGFKQIIIDPSDISDKIFIEALIETLEPITITPSAYPEKYSLIKVPSDKQASMSAYSGFRLVTLLENPNDSVKRIRSFVFEIKKITTKGYPKAKVILFRNDHGIPGEPIGKERVFDLSTLKSRTIEIFMDPNTHILPNEGAFVGLEWMGCIDDPEYQDKCNLSVRCKEVERADGYVRPTFVSNVLFMPDWRDMNAGTRPEFPFLVPVFGITIFD